MSEKVSTDNITKNWNPIGKSANADMLDDLESMYSKSRDLEKTNGIAISIIDTLVEKTIGQGLKLTPSIDYKILGWTSEKAKIWNEKTERLWHMFASSNNFDVSGKNNFNALSRLTLRTVLMNGEVLALPYWDKFSSSMFNTQIKLVECDRLQTPPRKENVKNVHGGIKFDKNGRPVEYYISKTYPGDNIFYSDEEFQTIKSKTPFGRKRVLHIFKQDRVDQSRGKPIFSPVLTQFKKLDMYEGAELSAAVVSALIALIVESPNMEDDELVKFFGIEKKPELLPQLKTQWDRGLKDGSILQLFPGEKAHGFTPNRPNAAFSAFIETNVKQICVAAGLPYEMVMKDFSKCNYSSARAALQEGWERILTLRDWFVTEWVKEIYSLFIEEIANKGLIEAPDFYKYKEAYLKFIVHGPTRGILDPVKEAKASDLRLTSGLTTLQYECSMLGLDYEDVMEQQAIEQNKRNELGLNFNQSLDSKTEEEIQDDE